MRCFLFLFVLLIGSTSSFAIEIEVLKISTGENGDVLVKFNKATHMPVGASDERAEVLGVNLSLFGPPRIELAWHYVVRFKAGSVPTRIRVEDETQAPNRLELESTQPALQQARWVGESSRMAFTREMSDHLQAKDDWFSMRKFTIDYAVGTQSILHQAVLLTSKKRMEFLHELMREPTP